MRLIDSQIHLFAPGDQEFATRMLQHWMSAEEVVAEMDQVGVMRAYLVPGNAAGNPACVEATRRWPERFRVMGIVGLDKPASRELMANWEQSGFLGVRLTFPPYRPVSWLRDGTADWFWPIANERGLSIMVWAPQQLPELGRLAEQYPRIRFIFDHLNLFVQDKGEVVDKAVQDLLPMARHGNVAVKLSALPAHSNEGFPFRDMHGHIAQVVRAFGAERCMWGTDLTRKACTYDESIRMFTEHLPFLNTQQLARIMGGSADEWLPWGSP